MRGLPGVVADLAAALGTALLLARHAKPQPYRPAGLVPQAFRYCRHCDRVTAHLIHSPDFRRCLTCNRYPGDDR
jgi:hypothetical protein